MVLHTFAFSAIFIPRWERNPKVVVHTQLVEIFTLYFKVSICLRFKLKQETFGHTWNYNKGFVSKPFVIRF